MTTARWKVLWMEADARASLYAIQEGRGVGLHVVVARDGTEALDLLNRLTFDAEVYAVPLGGADPGHLVRLSRDAFPRPPRFRAWVLQADDLWDRVAASHEGVDRVFRYPAPPAQVARSIVSWLERRDAVRCRVLLLEDDPITRDTLARLLDEAGFDVVTLDEPERFLAVLGEREPDAVLMDVDLPRIGGLDLCRVARGHPRWENLPILFYTAQVGMEQRIAAMKAGADDVIPKPCSPEELSLRLLRRLAGREPRPAGG